MTFAFFGYPVVSLWKTKWSKVSELLTSGHFGCDLCERSHEAFLSWPMSAQQHTSDVRLDVSDLSSADSRTHYLQVENGWYDDICSFIPYVIRKTYSIINTYAMIFDIQNLYVSQLRRPWCQVLLISVFFLGDRQLSERSDAFLRACSDPAKLMRGSSAAYRRQNNKSTSWKTCKNCGLLLLLLWGFRRNGRGCWLHQQTWVWNQQIGVTGVTNKQQQRHEAFGWCWLVL